MNDTAPIRSAACHSAGVPAGLLAALSRLDALLDHCVQDLLERGADANTAARGLYVSAQEATGLLARGPLTPVFAPFGGNLMGALTDPAAGASPLEPLARWFGLSDFDLDLVLIALAPEIDLRYERLYGFLQDDTTRRRASVDLALSLRCVSATDKLARLAHFSPDAPLIRHAVLHLATDPQHVQPPLPGHFLTLDPQITAALLGHRGLDQRLSGFCQLNQSRTALGGSTVAPETRQALLTLASAAMRTERPLILYLKGRRGMGQHDAVAGLAGALGSAVLHVDLARLSGMAADIAPALRLAFREAWLKDHLLYFDAADALCGTEREAAATALMSALAAHPGISVMAGEQDWPMPVTGPADFVRVDFATPGVASRREVWREGLAVAGIAAAPPDIDALAARFRFGAEAIGQALAAARGLALWRGATEGDPAPTVADLFAAARGQSGQGLRTLARRIAPKQGWNDLVLPPAQTAQLREICDQARLRPMVHGDWGFARKLSTGGGLNVLFAGPPGTGKTMAAEVIADALHLDLYKIDLSQVVSKYIGETEKNLDRIFTAAETADAILFFDEADALFGHRSEVKDSHDRYANIQVAYLLQKMEEFEGVAILATNLRQNMDDAFLRRLQAVVEFPFPDEAQRRRIWDGTFPTEAPLDFSVDFAALARTIRLSGGNIRNIALAGAFYAAADGGKIGMAHLVRAARREHEKLGRAWEPGGK